MKDATLRFKDHLIHGRCEEWLFELLRMDNGWSGRIDVGSTTVSIYQAPSAAAALLRAAAAAQDAVRGYVEEGRALEELLQVAFWCVGRAP